MQSFVRHRGIAAPLLEADIDTDTIYPARFLLLTDREGLGDCLFRDRRDAGGFVLDNAVFAGASILIAGANFGCGSSREQAVWTLLGAGYLCVIAPSFGDIFYANSFKNGLLPIQLPADIVSRLGVLAVAGMPFEIDLERQTVSVDGGPSFEFAIDGQRRRALLNGYDEIDEILMDDRLGIEAFEAGHRCRQPWLFLPAEAG